MYRKSTTSLFVGAAAAAALFLAGGAAHAVTIQIGDSDSFGFSNSEINTLLNADGDPIDANSDDKLTAGDYLPNLSGDDSATHWSDIDDHFDNRTAAEGTDSSDPAYWTDVTLSQETEANWSDGVGEFDDFAFSFSFTAPTVGDSDYGVDHFINFLVGDLAESGGGSVSVNGGSGVGLQSFSGAGLGDGGITATSISVPWSEVQTGNLNVTISSSDPFVAIDAILLDAQQRAPGSDPTIPEPGVLAMFGVGLAGIGFAARRRRHV